jgi:hypothetical protein
MSGFQLKASTHTSLARYPTYNYGSFKDETDFLRITTGGVEFDLPEPLENKNHKQNKLKHEHDHEVHK